MSTRDEILKALQDGPKSSSQLVSITGLSKSSVNDMRRTLMRHKLVVKCGEVKTLNGGVGMEGVYCLTAALVEKKVAKNAFDWRNWEPQAAYSERELAYSNASFLNRKESRVIVYSRA